MHMPWTSLMTDTALLLAVISLVWNAFFILLEFLERSRAPWPGKRTRAPS